MNLQNAHKETRDWMAAFGQETPEVAVVPTKEVLQLRYKLIDEEINKELLPGLDGLYFALGEYKKRDDFLQTLDGLGDSLFVVIGTFVALGVDTQQV
jgi:predicted HAD superfamily Cof-like phosphohydrolase